jgi:hypothetical protein
MEAGELREREAWRRLKAAAIEDLIEPRRALYLRTKNPVHALNAYRIARSTKIDIPGWILELFDQWAEVLCVKRPKGEKAIAGALGLIGQGGGPSITSQAETQIRNLRIARRVLELRERDPERSMQDVFDQVAKEIHLSPERVSAIWRELMGDPQP